MGGKLSELLLAEKDDESEGGETGKKPNRFERGGRIDNRIVFFAEVGVQIPLYRRLPDEQSLFRRVLFEACVFERTDVLIPKELPDERGGADAPNRHEVDMLLQ